MVRQVHELAVVSDTAVVAAQHLADHVDVLAGALQRLAVGLAVPTLDHLRSTEPETETEPAVTQMIHGDRVHRAAGGRAAGDLHDAGANLDPLGMRCDPRSETERVVAPRFGNPHGVEAEPLRLLGERHMKRIRAPAPIAELQTELHVRGTYAPLTLYCGC